MAARQGGVVLSVPPATPPLPGTARAWRMGGERAFSEYGLALGEREALLPAHHLDETE